MTGNAPSSDNGSVQRPRGGWLMAIGAVFGIVALLVLIFVVGLVIARRPVAAFLAERYLGAMGIASDISFSELSLEGFDARIRLGPASSPDFEAEEIEARLDFPSGFSLPTLVSARLVRPFLKTKYDGKRISLGSLDPLLRMGGGESVPGSTIGPDIGIDDATVIADTPFGEIQFAVDANLAHGKLQRFQAVLQPATLKTGSLSVQIAGGAAMAAPVGDLLNVSFSFDAASASNGNDNGDANIRMLHAAGDIRGLEWTADKTRTRFRIQGAKFDMGADGARAAQASATQPAIAVMIGAAQGTIDGGRLTAVAPIDVGLSLGPMDAGGASLTSASAQVAMPTATIDTANNAYTLSGPLRVQAMARGFAYANTAIDTIALDLGSESRTLSVSDSGWSLAGAMHGMVDGAGVTQTMPGGTATATLHASFDGPVRIASGDVAIMLAGSASGNGTLTEGAGRELARNIPILGSDDRFVSAMTAAWRRASLQARGFTIATSKDGTRVTFTAPATATGNNGAKLTLSPQTGGPLLASGADGTSGAFTADLSGRDLPALHLALPFYRMNAQGLAATASFDATLDYRDMRGLAISGAGDLSADDTRLSFTPARCTDVKLATLLANGAPFVSAGAARLCADTGKALFSSDAAGWRFGGRWDGATAALDFLQSALSAGDGRVDLSGNASGLTSGTFEIAHSALDDRLSAARFRQIAISGQGTMTAKDVNATLGLSAHGRAFASVALKQSLADGTGSASIDASGLDFASGKFQPGDISPMLAMLGSRVTGKASFTGQLAWKDGTIDSSGHLTANDVDFQSPLGQVRQADTDIAFSSLIPFAAGSGQTFSATRIDSLVPIEAVATVFSFTQQAVRIEQASAKVAGGTASVEPMTYVFAPDATTLGTLKVQNIDLAPLLMAAGLASRVEANAHLDGSIPFSSGPAGLRFADGSIAANAPGRLSIKREALVASAGVGAGGATPPNAVQDFAYQALENLAFDRLEGTVNSRPMGRLGVLFHIVGWNDPPQGAEARVGLFDLIQGSAFDKPIPLPKGTPIDLTLDTSINLDELLAAYRASSSP